MNSERCSQSVWENGTAILVVAEMESEKLDNLCMLLQNESDVLWDWSYMGGWAVVQYLGDDLRALRCLCANLGLVQKNTEHWRFHFSDSVSGRETLSRLRTGYYDGVHDFGLRRSG